MLLLVGCVCVCVCACVCARVCACVGVCVWMWVGRWLCVRVCGCGVWWDGWVWDVWVWMWVWVWVGVWVCVGEYARARVCAFVGLVREKRINECMSLYVLSYVFGIGTYFIIGWSISPLLSRRLLSITTAPWQHLSCKYHNVTVCTHSLRCDLINSYLNCTNFIIDVWTGELKCFTISSPGTTIVYRYYTDTNKKDMMTMLRSSELSDKKPPIVDKDGRIEAQKSMYGIILNTNLVSRYIQFVSPHCSCI